MVLTYENIEEVADFIGSPTIAVSNPSGDQTQVSFEVNGKKMLRPLGFVFVKNDEGHVAAISTGELDALYEPVPKEIEK